MVVGDKEVEHLITCALGLCIGTIVIISRIGGIIRLGRGRFDDKELEKFSGEIRADRAEREACDGALDSEAADEGSRRGEEGSMRGRKHLPISTEGIMKRASGIII